MTRELSRSTPFLEVAHSRQFTMIFHKAVSLLEAMSMRMSVLPSHKPAGRGNLNLRRTHHHHGGSVGTTRFILCDHSVLATCQLRQFSSRLTVVPGVGHVRRCVGHIGLNGTAFTAVVLNRGFQVPNVVGRTTVCCPVWAPQVKLPLFNTA